MRYYSLYYNKNKDEIKIKLLKERDSMYSYAVKKCIKENTLLYHNCNYFLSNNRRIIKEKALSIRKEWLDELAEKIFRIKLLKI